MLTRKSAVIKSIEGRRVVFCLENDQYFTVEKEDLYKPAPGQEYVIEIIPVKEAELKKDELAKEIVNQLLENNEDGEK